MTVIDTNNNVTHKIDFLLSKGVMAVGRYYSSGTSKRIGPAEAHAISAAGMKIFVVFEDSGDPLLTSANGVHHAQIAAAQAGAIGQPHGSAIYFALEHLPNGYTSADIPAVKTYMAGVNSALGGQFRVGAYSDGVVCEALLDAGLCSYTWLSASSSFAGTKMFYKSNRWSLAQNAKVDQVWDGLSVDTNEAMADFGAFVVGAPAPAQGAAFAHLAVAAGAMGGGVAASTFTVQRNHRYQATVTLFGLEQFAGNDAVAERLQNVGFRDVAVTGSGRVRQAQATWPGPDTTAQLDAHLGNVVDIT